MVNGYKNLFEGDSPDELKAKYEAIVGDSFDVIDPSMQQLFDNANQDVNTAAQNICGDLGRGSLSLDQAILVRTAYPNATPLRTAIPHKLNVPICPFVYTGVRLPLHRGVLPRVGVRRQPDHQPEDAQVEARRGDLRLERRAAAAAALQTRGVGGHARVRPRGHGARAREDARVLAATLVRSCRIQPARPLHLKPPPPAPGRNIAQQTSGANVGRDHSADGLGYGPV